MAVVELSPMQVAAYAQCRRMLRRHDPSYYLAVTRLPPERRSAVHALYGFVRGADEIVDGSGRALDPEQRRAALDRYMNGSGASVGRIMAPILGAPEESERLARLGVAFQLTNFLRDVRQDYELDRIYLPADERARLGVRDEDLAARAARPALRELVAAEVRRARALFAE